MVGYPEVILGPDLPGKSCQLLVSRVTGQVESLIWHLSGKRVNRELPKYWLYAE
jgi:hypothetical protein